LAKDSFKDIDAQAERIAKAIYDGELVAGDVDATLLQLVAKKLRESLIKGFGIDFTDIDVDTPDFEMLTNLEKNVYQFSTAKNYAELKELTLLLKNDAGDILPFNEFKNEVIKTHTLYNSDWLRTEYETATNSSQMASKWVEFDKNKDALPFLIYQTAGDKRVRASHRALDGIKRNIDDEFWNTYYPPNGYKCRCTVNQSGNGSETNIDNIKFPKVEPMFQTNLAKSNLVFPDNHPYFDGVPKKVLNKYYKELKNVK
jgi:SPP1 gp7 family putative phage head morphogenesis protein